MNKPEVTSDKYSKSIKISLVLCWIGLIVCCLIKLFGGNFFSINVENSRFIDICNYIDNSIVLVVGIQLLNYILISYLYMCGTFRKTRLSSKECIILLITFITLSIIKRFLPVIGSILEIVAFVALPIIIAKCKWYLSLLYYALYNVFCLISVFTKDIGNLRLPDNTLVGLIFMIDVYFMLILFMLYNKKKEMKNNG
ncbi:MAG: hypothetical protein IJ371_02870 [Clostridia bacterium]|nr:hypothetical protein [Clostridia bacterium]